MSDAARGAATRTLNELRTGDASAAERLMPLVYDELHALAERHFRGQRPDHTLQPTALVHEAFLRLVGQKGTEWEDRAHFLAVAATAMRQILVNHAAQRSAAKRGGSRGVVPLLDEVDAVAGHTPDAICAVHEALEAFASINPRAARVIEMRFFGGMTMTEVAHVLGLSKRTAEADWHLGRAWLSRELAGS